MGSKQIKIKKSAVTLTTVMIGILLVMAMFFGGYSFISENVESAGSSLDSKYQSSYDNLKVEQVEMRNQTELIRRNLDDIKEAEEAYQVAWNGLKGLGNTLKLLASFTGSVLATWTHIVPTLDILPGWAIALIFTGILIFLVLLFLAIWKGEPKV